MSGARLFPERIEGRHVFYGLVVFFGVMLIANGFFLYYALGTFNGFETTDAYRRGLNYNQRVAAEKAQNARGWQPAVRYDQQARRLVVEVRDRRGRGRGVAGLRIAGEIRRPATDSSDQMIVLQEFKPGFYATALDLAPGQWTLFAQLFEQGSDVEPAHRMKQRLWVEADR